MTPLTTILAATDFSTPARHAVERAARLAAQTGRELHILHAMELDALDSLKELLGMNLNATKITLEAAALERLVQLAAEISGTSAINAYTHVVSGTALATVGREAEAMDAGILVLGARGESLLRHTMLGSTAERLLRKSLRRPVLVVKQTPRTDYQRALIAVDFSPVAPALIQAARRWAPAAEIVLLHAFELPYEGMLWRAGIEKEQITQLIETEVQTRRKRLHQLASSAGLQPADYAIKVVHGDASQQLIAIEQESGTDLIVLGKHGTHIAEVLLLGSVTKHVLIDAQSDVLVICDPRPVVPDLP
jgi:nucleotide-binding universal stress UspA family protein